MTPQRILVVKHGAFGDLLQAEGVLHDIRLFFRDADIVLLTQPAYQAMMERCPSIDAVLTDKRSPLWRLSETRALRQTLRDGRFELVIDLQNSQRTRLYRRLLLPDTQWIQRSARVKPASGLQGQIDLLEHSGINIEHSRRPVLDWLADDMQAWLAQRNIQPEFVLLLPGCSARRPEKRWPFFSQLAEELEARAEKVVTVLGPDEPNLVGAFKGSVLTGLNLSQLAGVIQLAGFVMGNDSGPSHLAAHLGKSGMALFGPHSSAARAEIETAQFKPYSVSSLAALSVQTLVDHLLDRGAICSRTNPSRILISDHQRPADPQPDQSSHPVIQ